MPRTWILKFASISAVAALSPQTGCYWASTSTNEEWCWNSRNDDCSRSHPNCGLTHRYCPSNYGNIDGQVDPDNCYGPVCTINRCSGHGTCSTSELHANWNDENTARYRSNVKNNYECTCDPGFTGDVSDGTNVYNQVHSPDGRCDKCIDDFLYEYPHCDEYRPWHNHHNSEQRSRRHTEFGLNDCNFSDDPSSEWSYVNPLCNSTYVPSNSNNWQEKCSGVVSVSTRFKKNHPPTDYRTNISVWLECPWECNRCKKEGKFKFQVDADTAQAIAVSSANATGFTLGFEQGELKSMMTALNECEIGASGEILTVGCSNQSHYISHVDSSAFGDIQGTCNAGDFGPYAESNCQTHDLTNFVENCCLGQKTCSVSCNDSTDQCVCHSSPIEPENISGSQEFVGCSSPIMFALKISCDVTTSTTTTVTTVTTSTSTTEVTCSRGQLLNATVNECETCPEGQYQNQDEHTSRECMKHHPCDNSEKMFQIFGNVSVNEYPSICIEIGSVYDCPDDKEYWHPGNADEFVKLVNQRQPWHLQMQGGPSATDISKAVTAVVNSLAANDSAWRTQVTEHDLVNEFLSELDSNATQNQTFPALMCIEATQKCGTDDDLEYEKEQLTPTSDRVCSYCPVAYNATHFDSMFIAANDQCPNVTRPFHSVNGTVSAECLLPSMVEATNSYPTNDRCCRVSKVGHLKFNDTSKRIYFDKSEDLTPAYKPVFQDNKVVCRHRMGDFEYKSTTTTTTTTSTTITSTTTTTNTTTTTSTTKTTTTTQTTTTTTPVSHKLRNRKIGYWVQGGLLVVVLALLLCGKCSCLENRKMFDASVPKFEYKRL